MMVFLSAMLGLSLGSFANVCIYRIPLGISVVTPRSFCPRCRRQLKWFELIPIVSYLILMRRCGSCKQRISLQYPLVELASGLMAVYLVTRYSVTLSTFIAMSLLLLLLIIVIIDWRNLIIPNSLVIVGLVLGVAIMLLTSIHSLLIALLSGIAAGTAMFMIRSGGNYLFKKDTMGVGDIKLAVLVGFLIGIQEFLFAVWAAAVIGCLYWILVQAFRRVPTDVKLPFGSFLSLVSIVLFIAPIHLVHYSVIPLFSSIPFHP